MGIRWPSEFCEGGSGAQRKPKYHFTPKRSPHAVTLRLPLKSAIPFANKRRSPEMLARSSILRRSKNGGAESRGGLGPHPEDVLGS